MKRPQSRCWIMEKRTLLLISEIFSPIRQKFTTYLKEICETQLGDHRAGSTSHCLTLSGYILKDICGTQCNQPITDEVQRSTAWPFPGVGGRRKMGEVLHIFKMRWKPHIYPIFTFLKISPKNKSINLKTIFSRVHPPKGICPSILDILRKPLLISFEFVGKVSGLTCYEKAQ